LEYGSKQSKYGAIRRESLKAAKLSLGAYVILGNTWLIWKEKLAGQEEKERNLRNAS
jgi:hypothetical protein